ncbi:MAG: M28 family peptidase [Terriglobales bacterium]
MRIIRIASWLLALTCLVQSQTAPAEKHLVKRDVFNAIANEYSGEMAQEYTRHIIQYHRIQGSPMMADSAEMVLARLKQLGIEAKLEKFASDGKIKYQTHISPMSWDMRAGELWVESAGGSANFEPYRLCRYSDVPMCVSTYSKPGEWSGELVDVDAGTADRNYEGVDVKGKVALAYGYAANVVRKAVLKYGAIGVVIYPSPTDRPQYPDLIRYNGIWPRAEEYENTRGGFQISANQYAKLKALMRSGPVRVKGTIDATLGSGAMTLVHAYIRGTKDPQQEVMVTAHLDHPKWSANDNASGSGGMVELVRTLQTLIAQKKITAPERSIHFMWIPEFFGTMAYVTHHPEARRCGDWDDPRKPKPWTQKDACIIANINLDMIGEDTVKTNSRMYATRTPDSVPSYLDALLTDVMRQTRNANLYAPSGTRNYWQPEMIDYTQGSDHDIFNGLGIPSTMFGHDPDWTHHSSEDNIDKTDASEFRRVGVMAGAATWWLAGSDFHYDFSIATSHAIATLEARRTQAKAKRTHQKYSWDQTVLDNVDGVLARRIKHHRDRAASFRSTTGPGISSPGWIDDRLQEGLGSTVTSGPRRLTLLPIYGAVFEPIAGEDKKWWDEQGARFAEDDGPNFGLVVYEAINLMDGRRSTNDISMLLSGEYLMDLDHTWVDRLVGILEKHGLVTTKPVAP